MLSRHYPLVVCGTFSKRAPESRKQWPCFVMASGFHDPIFVYYRSFVTMFSPEKQALIPDSRERGIDFWSPSPQTLRKGTRAFDRPT